VTEIQYSAAADRYRKQVEAEWLRRLILNEIDEALHLAFTVT